MQEFKWRNLIYKNIAGYKLNKSIISENSVPFHYVLSTACMYTCNAKQWKKTEGKKKNVTCRFISTFVT